MKKKTFAFLLFTLISMFSFSQVTIKLGSVENAVPGTYVNFPLIVTGLSESGQAFIGIEFLFEFQPNIMTFDSLADGNPVTPVSQWFAGSMNGKISSNWLHPNLEPVHVEDNSVLVEYVFYYTGGQSDLIIDQAATVIYDQNANPIAISSFINGSITQGQGSDNSTWNGTDNWGITDYWSHGIPGDNTNAIIASGTVTLTSGGVCKNLNVNPGARLIIASGSSLTVNGDLDNKGEILIQSDSVIQGSLIVKGVILESGQFTMAMDIYQDIEYQFASPVQNITASLFSQGMVKSYSENSGSWDDVPGNSVLQVGRGYSLVQDIGQEILLTGPFNSEKVILDLSMTEMEDQVMKGLNLIGNPFTSSFNTNTYLTLVNADRAIYIWDGNRYKVWNGVAGNIPGGIIPPFSALFVRANNDLASATFEKSGQIHDFSHYSTDYINEINVLQINLTNFDNNIQVDEIFLQIEDNSTYGYDGPFDALKLPISTAPAEIYLTGKSGERYAIEAIPEAIESDLGMRTTQNGTYMISGVTSNSMPGKPVFLLDKELQIIKDLRSENYVFNINQGDYPSRFVIVLTGIGVQEYESGKVPIVYGHDHEVYIVSEVDSGKARISIFDAAGRKCIDSEKTLSDGMVHRIKGIKGLNIVVIRTETAVYSYKLFLE